MKIDHDNLKKAYRRYAESRRQPDRDQCPSPESIARSFEPWGSARKRRNIIDHISLCTACREEFMMFLECQRAEAADAPEIAPAVDLASRFSRRQVRPARRPSIWQYASLAIGLCLALSSFVIIVRHVDYSSIRQSSVSELILLYPKTDQTISSSIYFRWRRQPGVEYYIVELFDDQMLPLWTSGMTHDLETRPPTDISSLLKGGQSYYWMVTGYARGGKSGESRLGRFRIGR